MRHHFALLIPLVGCLAIAIAAPSPLAGAELNRRYLAVDPTLHAQLEQMEMVMGQASDRRVILKLDQRWEEDNELLLGYFGSVIEDHDGRYRAYYEVRAPQGKRMTAIAFSDDGVNWTKPELNIDPDRIDHPSSNLIDLPPHPGMRDGRWYTSAHAYHDEHVSDAAARYKLAWNVGSNVHVATSADGLHFETLGLAFNHKADTSPSFFFDDRRSKYVMYGRKRNDWSAGPAAHDRRGIVRHSSPSWDVDWPNVGQVVVDPVKLWDYTDGSDGTEPTGPDVYTSSVQPYHGQYIGLPAVFFRDGNRVPVNRPERTTGTGPIYPLVMHSLDGEEWSFPDLEHPIIDLFPHLRVSSHPEATSDAEEVGQIYPASNFIEQEDRLLIYYVHRQGTHYEPHLDKEPRSLNVAFLRVDGFASLRARDGRRGQWVTPGLRVPDDASGLHVNADVAGSLHVEVLDAETGDPFDGLALNDAIPFSGDRTDARLQWESSSFKDAGGREVRLRFVVTDGEIFSFWFARRWNHGCGRFRRCLRGRCRR